MNNTLVDKRVNTIGDHLKRHFGGNIYKVSLWAGLSCPNRDGTKGKGGCVFCQPDALMPADMRGGEPIDAQLERGIRHLKKRYRAERFIAYLQAYTNTYGDVDTLRAIYHRAIDHPDVVGLAVSTRPDAIDHRVLDLFSEMDETTIFWVEYGLQSAKDETLRFLNRGHTLEDFLRTYEETVKRGIRVCVHVILGLPNETRDDMLDTAHLLTELRVWGVKIHHLQIHRGTQLETLYKKGLVRVLSLEEYIPLVIDFIEHLHPDIIIHRLIGDVPERFLVAPRWGNKLSVLRMINRYMDELDTFQGAKI